MSKRLLSCLLAVLVAFVLCCVPAFADESSSASADISSAVSDTTSKEVSEIADDATGETTGNTTGNTTGEDTESGNRTPWGLFIALFLMLCFVVVCFVCIKVKNRFGLWLAKFLRDYKSEFKKISWLSPKELVKQTGVTLIILIVAAIVLGLLDWGFSSLIELLARL